MTSSGDLLADRRFAWGRVLAESGDHAAAADLFAQAVERAPAWAAGWAALGEARERAGDAEGARGAWARAAALDPEGRLGAALHLARLEGRTPDAMAAPYVAALFDDYAPRFERHLTETLRYRGPALILAGLERAAPGRRFGRVLDLGCGTGLMGLALRERAERIEGVDLSPAMVARAQSTGAYAALTVASLADTLAEADAAAYDLVVAADVLVYLGDLAPVCAGAARTLAPGGLFAFTAQGGGGAPEAPAPFALGPDLRFAHAPVYVRAELLRAGFATVRLEEAWARTEQGRPVPGFVGVAER